MRKISYRFAGVSSLAFGLLALAGCGSAGGNADEKVGTTQAAEHASNSDPNNTQLIDVSQAGAQTLPVILMNQKRDPSLFSGYSLNCPNDVGGMAKLIAGAGFNPNAVPGPPTLDVVNDNSLLHQELGVALYPDPDSVEQLSDIWAISCQTSPSNFHYIDVPAASGSGTERKYFVYLGHFSTDGNGNQTKFLHNIGCGELMVAMGLQLSQATVVGATDSSYSYTDTYDINCASGTPTSSFVPSLVATLTAPEPGNPAAESMAPGAHIPAITLTPVDMPADSLVLASPGGTCVDPATGSSFLTLTANANAAGVTVGTVGGPGGLTVPVTFTGSSCTQSYVASSASAASQTPPVTITIDIKRPPHRGDEIILAGIRGATTMPIAASNYAATSPVKSFTVTEGDATNAATNTVFVNGAAQYGMGKLAGDFDGDGRTDVAIVGAVGATSVPVAFGITGGNWNVVNVEDGPSGGFAAKAAAGGVRRFVGDFDGDGKSDIALTGSATFGGLPVAFSAFSAGQGSWRVPAVDPTSAAFAALSATARATFTGDFDNDGKTDIALAPQLSGNGTMPVARSNGRGTWTISLGTIKEQGTPVFVTLMNAPGVEVLTGDFNGDGATDVALTGPSAWTTIPIAYGDGTGNWTAVDTDVLGATVTPDPATKQFAESSSAQGVTRLVGDFDGDGRSDIALVGPAGWTDIPLACAKGNGVWSSSSPGANTFAGEASATGVTPIVGDFNRDGLSDIALTGNASWGYIPVALAVANGIGASDTGATFGADDWGLTNGGFARLANATNQANSNAVKLVGYASGAHIVVPDPQPKRPTPGANEVLFVGGVGGSTVPAIVANDEGDWTFTNGSVGAAERGFTLVGGSRCRGNCRINWGLDFGWLASPYRISTPSTPITGGGWTPHTGDFNGDGLTDIALTSGTAIPVAFSIGGGNWSVPYAPTSAPSQTLTFPSIWQTDADQDEFSLVGDFDGDGMSDLLTTGGFDAVTIAPTSAMIALSNGDATWRTPAPTTLPAEFSEAQFAAAKVGAPGPWAADFNADGLTDLASAGTPPILAFSNGASGTFRTAPPILGPDCTSFTAWAAGAQVLYGDFNGDGRTDVALTGAKALTTIPVAFASPLNDGHWTCTNMTGGTFAAQAASAAAASYKALVGDFDGDGKSDIALVGSNSSNNPIAFSNGDGSWRVTGASAAVAPLTESEPPLLGDFNRDGRADFAFVSATSAEVTLSFSNGDGSWTVSVPSTIAVTFGEHDYAGLAR